MNFALFWYSVLYIYFNYSHCKSPHQPSQLTIIKPQPQYVFKCNHSDERINIKYECYFVYFQVSITFDPFMILPVPLPKRKRLLPITFMPCQPHVKPTKVKTITLYLIDINISYGQHLLKVVVIYLIDINISYDLYRLKVIVICSIDPQHEI